MRFFIDLTQTRAKFLGLHTYFALCDGKMRFVTIILQTYDFTTGETRYTVKDVSTNETFTISYDDIYDDECSFNHNENSKRFVHNYQSKHQIEQDGDNAYAIRYVIENGKPCEKKSKITKICDFTNSVNESYDEEGIITGYETYDICLDFNSYIKNEKGEDIKVDGRCVKLLLSPKQKALVEKFQCVMQELKDNNISVINHDYISGLFFVNNGGGKLDIDECEDKITDKHMRYLHKINQDILPIDDCYNIVP